MKEAGIVCEWELLGREKKSCAPSHGLPLVREQLASCDGGCFVCDTYNEKLPVLWKFHGVLCRLHPNDARRLFALWTTLV